MNEAGGLITIQDAAKRAERHASTIKRWIADKRLTPHKRGKGKTAPVMVEARELMALLADQTPRARVVASQSDHERSTPSKAELTLAKELEAAREDHRRELETLRLVIADLRADKERGQRELTDARERIAALERELNGGVRGLLRGLFGGGR